MANKPAKLNQFYTQGRLDKEAKRKAVSGMGGARHPDDELHRAYMNGYNGKSSPEYVKENYEKAISQIQNDKPVELGATFVELIAPKLVERIEAHKAEYVKTLFGGTNED